MTCGNSSKTVHASKGEFKELCACDARIRNLEASAFKAKTLKANEIVAKDIVAKTLTVETEMDVTKLEKQCSVGVAKVEALCDEETGDPTVVLSVAEEEQFEGKVVLKRDGFSLAAGQNTDPIKAVAFGQDFEKGLVSTNAEAEKGMSTFAHSIADGLEYGLSNLEKQGNAFMNAGFDTDNRLGVTAGVLGDANASFMRLNNNEGVSIAHVSDVLGHNQFNSSNASITILALQEPNNAYFVAHPEQGLQTASVGENGNRELAIADDSFKLTNQRDEENTVLLQADFEVGVTLASRGEAFERPLTTAMMMNRETTELLSSYPNEAEDTNFHGMFARSHLTEPLEHKAFLVSKNETFNCELNMTAAGFFLASNDINAGTHVTLGNSTARGFWVETPSVADASITLANNEFRVKLDPVEHKIGFFDVAPVFRQSASTLDEVIDALKAYGLLNHSS